MVRASATRRTSAIREREMQKQRLRRALQKSKISLKRRHLRRLLHRRAWSILRSVVTHVVIVIASLSIVATESTASLRARQRSITVSRAM
jgi:hypothetical protein